MMWAHGTNEAYSLSYHDTSKGLFNFEFTQTENDLTPP